MAFSKLVFSKHNIFSRIRGSDNYFIVNLLARNADILTPEKADEIVNKDYTDISEYREKGYLVEEDEEGRLYRSRYLDFLDSRDNSEVPWLTHGSMHYYQLTDKGRAEPPHEAWSNWRQLWLLEGYPELE